MGPEPAAYHRQSLATRSAQRAGSRRVSSPQNTPTIEHPFNSVRFNGIFGISPAANPTTGTRPRHAMDRRRHRTGVDRDAAGSPGESPGTTRCGCRERGVKADRLQAAETGNPRAGSDRSRLPRGQRGTTPRATGDPLARRSDCGRAGPAPRPRESVQPPSRRIRHGLLWSAPAGSAAAAPLSCVSARDTHAAAHFKSNAGESIEII